MIQVYARNGGGRLEANPAIPVTATAAAWIDLYRPSEEEEAGVEAALGIDVPTHAERTAIEESARFYEEGPALILTPTLPGRREDGPFNFDAVMFVLIGGKLVTVRNINPRAFDSGHGRASARIASAQTGAEVFLALIEGVVERMADVLAETSKEANELSVRIFGRSPNARTQRETFRSLGRIGAIVAIMIDCLSSLRRMCAFVDGRCETHGLDRARIDAIAKDAEELERAAVAFQDRLVFLLDASVGLVSVNQNEILKALSVATIAFVPPTLISSIFGMNFDGMTWFHTWWGPWVGFGLMLLAPAALFALAKWRRWF